MNSRFHSCIRSGLVALGVLAGLCAPAAAAPFAGVGRTAVAPAVSEQSVVQVGYRRCYDGRCGRYGRHHLRHRYWDDDRRYRRYHRRYYNSYPDFYLGLSVPIYRYYAPPRRYYRGGGGSAHVAWCYSRYRSYRAWDNTYQPYYDSRRRCWSPYS
jgi:hypothetical protein